MRLIGEAGIITGSTSGIGRGIAIAMAKGAHIAVVNEEKGERH